MRPAVIRFFCYSVCDHQMWDYRVSSRPLSVFHADVSSSECIQNHFPKRLSCWECKWLQVVWEWLSLVKLQRQSYFSAADYVKSVVMHPTGNFLPLIVNILQNALDEHRTPQLTQQLCEKFSSCQVLFDYLGQLDITISYIYRYTMTPSLKFDIAIAWYSLTLTISNQIYWQDSSNETACRTENGARVSTRIIPGKLVSFL